jgi:Putative Actinobacterial Holin-X, holin superfamily III
VASTRSFGGNGLPVDEQSLGELVATATRDVSMLVHQEIELAKTELTEQASQAGVGIGILSGAGLLGVLAVILASFAGAFGFSDGLDLPLWAGFLCMTGVYLVFTALLGFLGVRRLRGLRGAELTSKAVKANLDWGRRDTDPTADAADMPPLADVR